MESLFVVLGIVGGLIAGFAITYFVFVGKLQKKLASAKKKLDRAQSANDEMETLQARFDAQKSELQAAEAKLQSLETEHQAQIGELESQQAAALQALEAEKAAIAAELQTLRETSLTPDQIPADQSEALAALQAQLAAVEEQHQADLQAQLAAVEEQYQAELQAQLAAVEQQYQEHLQAQLAAVEQQHYGTLQEVESRYQGEIESLRQSLASVPSPSVTETEPETDALRDQPETAESAGGGWGMGAAIAGGAAVVGGVAAAAFGAFGDRTEPESLEPEQPEEPQEPVETVSEWAPAPEIPAELETPEAHFEELEELTPVAELEALDENFEELTPVAELETLDENFEEPTPVAELETLDENFDGHFDGSFDENFEEPILEESTPPEFFSPEAAAPAMPELEIEPAAEWSPAFEEPAITDELPELAEAESSPFSDDFLTTDPFAAAPDLGSETESPFDFAESPIDESPIDIDTENWVDAPDRLELETEAPDFSAAADELLSTTDDFGLDAALPDLEIPEGDPFAAEIPEVAAETPMPDLDFLDVGTESNLELEEPTFDEQTLEDFPVDAPNTVDLFAELSDADSDADLDFLNPPDANELEDDLALPSNPGDILEMPDSFLADIPSFMPDESEVEDISEVSASSDDDLDFLLQLQEDEPIANGGEEFFPDFGEEDPLEANLPSMELLAEETPELSDLLSTERPIHGGDPFVNILDENPNPSDVDLLELLQDDQDSDLQPLANDDDLFSGLENMLHTDTPENESDLNDLDALLNAAADPTDLGQNADDVFSLEDLGLGDDKP